VLITGNERHFKPVRGEHAMRVCNPAVFMEELITGLMTGGSWPSEP
jgi:hypothetical protein